MLKLCGGIQLSGISGSWLAAPSSKSINNKKLCKMLRAQYFHTSSHWACQKARLELSLSLNRRTTWLLRVLTICCCNAWGGNEIALYVREFQGLLQSSRECNAKARWASDKQTRREKMAKKRASEAQLHRMAMLEQTINVTNTSMRKLLLHKTTSAPSWNLRFVATLNQIKCIQTKHLKHDSQHLWNLSSR